MVDLQTAVALHGFASTDTPHPPGAFERGLAEGVVHVDYADPGHVFRVTVELVPRRHLSAPSHPVADLTGVDVHLTALTVDTHLTVQLDGRGPAATAAVARYRDSYDRWASTCSRDDPGEPPSWPAEQLLHSVHLTVTDDVGTQYQMVSGEAGGDGAEWRDVRRFLPAPPAGARQLRLDVHATGGPTTRVLVPLADG